MILNLIVTGPQVGYTLKSRVIGDRNKQQLGPGEIAMKKVLVSQGAQRTMASEILGAIQILDARFASHRMRGGAVGPAIVGVLCTFIIMNMNVRNSI